MDGDRDGDGKKMNENGEGGGEIVLWIPLCLRCAVCCKHPRITLR
jgi:hypothetical protein